MKVVLPFSPRDSSGGINARGGCQGGRLESGSAVAAGQVDVAPRLADVLRGESQLAHHPLVPLFQGVESGNVTTPLVLNVIPEAQNLRPRAEEG